MYTLIGGIQPLPIESVFKASDVGLGDGTHGIVKSHWGQGPLETGRNMSGTLKGQDPFTWHVSTCFQRPSPPVSIGRTLMVAHTMWKEASRNMVTQVCGEHGGRSRVD